MRFLCCVRKCLVVFSFFVSSIVQGQLGLVDLVSSGDMDGQVNNSSSLVANTPVYSAVGELGGANISVPIQVPDGINGMTPQLSLTYTGGGDGVLGRGWVLSGLSSITRGGAQYFTDHELSVAAYEISDAYYMDGQRLVYYAGTYGQANSFYYKRAYDNSLVKVMGSVANGPYWFQVKSAAGLTLEYGNDFAYNSHAVKYHMGGQDWFGDLVEVATVMAIILIISMIIMRVGIDSFILLISTMGVT